MKQKKIERHIAIALFFAVMIAFSLADQDSKQLHKLYTGTAKEVQPKLAALLQLSQQHAPAR